MFALTRLFNAVTTLADNLAALSATVAEVNAGLRDRLALDGAGPADRPALNQAPPDGTEGAAAGDSPPATGRGRRKGTGAA